MSGVQQAVFQNQRSFGPPAIGSAYEGGYYAGEISTAGNGIADYRLVVSPASSGEIANTQWKTTRSSTAGTDSVIDGPTNSANMNNASHPAAQFCEGLTIGGFSDWYLPAKNELEVCYYNLKPSTQNNDTTSGTNTNAVPSRGSNYAFQNPAQTSAADFKTTGTQDFLLTAYWSSTQASVDEAWLQFFDAGNQLTWSKDNTSWRARAIRRVAI